jgi:hypothetical protein
VAGHAVTGPRLGKSAKIDRKRNKAFPHGFLPIVDMNSTPSGSVFFKGALECRSFVWCFS